MEAADGMDAVSVMVVKSQDSKESQDTREWEKCNNLIAVWLYM